MKPKVTTAIEDYTAMCWQWTMEFVEKFPGDVPFTFFGLDSSFRQHILVGSDYTENRTVYQNILQGYSLANEIMAFAIGGSCWLVRRTVDTSLSDAENVALAKKHLPSEQPDRIDAVFVAGRSREGISQWEGRKVTRADGTQTVEDQKGYFSTTGDPNFERSLAHSPLMRMISLERASESQKAVLKILITPERLKKYFEIVEVLETPDLKPNAARN